MKMQKVKKQNGFTLIEVLVVVAVTGILTVMATVIFINTVRNSKKAEITSEARQNSALVIDRLQKDARTATNLAISGTGRTLTISHPSGAIVWNCTLPSGTNNGFITRNSIAVTNKDNVDGVSLSDCKFEPAGSGSSNFATMDFTFTEGEAVTTGPQEFGVDLHFQTSVSTRQ